MCGIVGVLDRGGAQLAPEVAARMIGALRHRGPDRTGEFATNAGTAPSVWFGFARLSIIDLSAAADQPMTNEDGSIRIVFNGEVYNFESLREELERKGHTFRSAGDAETVLHLYEEEGVECLRRLRGMFAFALWDAREQTLFLARDRLGKKPLFYHDHGNLFLFASEPKAILQDRRIPATPHLESIHHYLTYGYVPSPWSAFTGIRKLPPAHYALVRGAAIDVHRYWTPRYEPKHQGSEAALGAELLTRLEEAVRLRLISDVPVGALLSGGIDSSTVVALMRRLTSGPVRTFSIGFEDPEYDELAYARVVAERFETEHHELVVKPRAIEVLPRLVWHYNEPFADSSALPSWYLCEMAKQFVTVALNGDGGDEAFAGYDRHLASMLAERYDRIPAPLRRTVARAAAFVPDGPPKSAIERLRRFAEALSLDPKRRYSRWLTTFDEDRKAELYTPEFGAEIGHRDSFAVLETAYQASDARNFLDATLNADLQLYLPDDLLVKMDIASMAHSLEVRSPLLDQEVVEFAASLPTSFKLRGFTQKYLLKKVMKGLLPDAILRRRKMGFGVPLDHWFRYDLREMAYDLLLDGRARARGYFRPEVIRRYLDEHVEGRARHHVRLWNLLMLELWHRIFVDQPCPAEPPLHL